MAPGETPGRAGDKETPARPFVSIPSAVHYEPRGYIIAGARHKLKCRCYACKVVRRRAREKRILRETFHCG